MHEKNQRPEVMDGPAGDLDARFPDMPGPPRVVVVGFGEPGAVVLRHMAEVGSPVPMAFHSGEEADTGLVESALEAALLFLVFDPARGPDLAQPLALADRARAEGILTFCCCVGPGQGVAMAALPRVIEQVKDHADGVYLVNGRLVGADGKMEAPDQARDCLAIIHAIAKPFHLPGFVGLDFSDVCAMFRGAGYVSLGAGHARGTRRAAVAGVSAMGALAAMGVELDGCIGIFAQLEAGLSLSLVEFSDVGELVEAYVGESVDVIVCTALEMSVVEESLTVRVVVAGVPGESVIPVWLARGA